MNKEVVEQKKIAASITSTDGEKDIKTISPIVAEKTEKIKVVPQKTNFLELDTLERIAIKTVYYHSRSVPGLIDGLSKLEFCDVQTSLSLLVAMEYITKSDADFLLGESEKMC